MSKKLNKNKPEAAIAIQASGSETNMNQLPNGHLTNLTKTSQPIIAAVYARVSTARQEEQETIGSQIAEIRTKILDDGNVIHPENIFQDDGWTGEMLQRPGLDAMRDAAQAGKFQVLYVYDRGRLSRVFAYQEIIIEEIINRDVKFVTLHDVKAETPEERVLQAMQGVFHEYERVKIVERMRRGKMFKAKNGILINGHSLYGYNYIKKVEVINDGIKQTKPARYEINQEEARVVKMIYDWVGNERISLKEVIRRLYDKKIPPRKRKSEFWTHGPIVRLLSCESYAKGVVYYNKHESVVAKKPIKNEKYKKIKRSSRRLRPKEEWIPFENIPKLIDPDLFKKVQEILNYNQRYACKKRKYDYLLSGLVDCQCGSPRVGDGVDGRNFYYRCSERIYKFPMEKQCKLQGLNAVALDEAFWKELVKFMTSPNRLKKHIERWFREQTNNEVDKLERERLSGLISKIVEEEKRYAKAYGVKTLEFENFKELVKDARKRKEAHQKELDTLNSKITQQGFDKIQFAEVYNEGKRVLQAQNLENRFQTTRDLIDLVILKERRMVEVKGHIPLFTVNMGYEPISWDSWTP